MTTIEQFRYRLQSQVTLSEGKENHKKQNTNTERDRLLVIGKCKFISTIHIYFYLYDYTKAKITIFFSKVLA
jgi:hypothetical protein